MSKSVCPTCEKPVEPREQNQAFPFCSSRCKLIDLGNWLDERYRVPGEEVIRDEDDDGSGGGSVH